MRFLDFYNEVPGVQPVDTTGTAVNSQFIDMKTVQELAFIVPFGTVTAATAGDVVTFTVTAATVQAGTSAVAVPFQYRISGAVAANTWGAWTDATSAGYAPTCATLTGKTVQIYVAPSEVAEEGADYRWANLVVTPDTNASACALSIICLADQRYKQTTVTPTT